MTTCLNCGKVAGGHSSILQGCMCQYSMQAPPQPERPAPCAKHCEATAFQITIKNLEAQLAQRIWVGLTKEQLATTDWSADFRAGALWAEAKLRSKNGY